MSSAQFNFWECKTAKITRPKIEILIAKIVKNCILQVHAVVISSCLVTAPTSFICCKEDQLLEF